MKTGPERRRRHGKELESALLLAGWEELVATGYGGLTMESVAVRANTSEAVLYRRWANKDELVLAAIVHYRKENPVVAPDTGALRGDLIAHLTAVAKVLGPFFAIATSSAFAGLLRSLGLTPAEMREKILGKRAHARLVYERAHERGEIDLTRIPAAVLDLPFDLIRHDLLMEMKAPKPARITSIVDELFLPLVARTRTTTD